MKILVKLLFIAVILIVSSCDDSKSEPLFSDGNGAPSLSEPVSYDDNGTPILAAGHAVVEEVGRKGGYGKYVRLRHGSSYQTAYAHMSRYAKGLKKGSRVKQGEVIGYVGSTGMSQAPHLHYEFVVNGVHRNPRTVPLPKADPLKGTQLAGFQTAAAPPLVKTHHRQLPE